MFLAGQEIGTYTLVKRIGRGGFGEVWLAERRTKFVTTKVAVKLPLDEQVDHEAIKHEAVLWEQASGHPNVLPIIDADEYDGQIIIVSEYAPDGSLGDLLKKSGALPVKKAVELVIGILSGLEYLHNKKIIHRDIKPANILLQGETPRLADFGISRVMKTTSVSVNMSGTPAYMAPEAFDRKRTVQTDVWSVGVILYQLLKGSLPFPHENLTDLLGAVIMREPELLPDSIPPLLQKIIYKALAKKPEERYESAIKMRSDLADFLISISQLNTKPIIEETKKNEQPAKFLPPNPLAETQASPTMTTPTLFAKTTAETASKTSNETLKLPNTEKENLKTNPLYLKMIAPFAVLILLAVGGLYFYINSQNLSGSRSNNGSKPQNSEAGTGTGKKIVVAMMPKAKSDPYFISCKAGAEKAAEELGVELLWDGPTDLDPAKQNEVVEAWITRGVDVIAVSVENKEGISTVLRKAKDKGIKVVTWDADAQKDARDFLINQATPQGIGETLADEAARIMGGKGEFAIVTASLSAANQNEWIKYIKQRLGERYSDIKLIAIQPSDGDRDRAFSETQNILKVYPNVKLVMGIAAPAVPGIAEAVKQSGRTDVKVTGLSLPNMCKPYIKDGVLTSIVLWNTDDLGYLTVHTSNALANGTLKRGDTKINAGRLKDIEVVDDEVRLGKPFIFNKDNVDNFNF